MAPEQHLLRPYAGEKVDVFALGVTLFMMYTKCPPFTIANNRDCFYLALAKKRHGPFWLRHSKGKQDDFFSKNFKDLFEKMVCLDPDERISMQEVMEHPWYTEESTVWVRLKHNFSSTNLFTLWISDFISVILVQLIWMCYLNFVKIKTGFEMEIGIYLLQYDRVVLPKINFYLLIYFRIWVRLTKWWLFICPIWNRDWNKTFVGLAHWIPIDQI